MMFRDNGALLKDIDPSYIAKYVAMVREADRPHDLEQYFDLLASFCCHDGIAIESTCPHPLRFLLTRGCCNTPFIGAIRFMLTCGSFDDVLVTKKKVFRTKFLNALRTSFPSTKAFHVANSTLPHAVLPATDVCYF